MTPEETLIRWGRPCLDHLDIPNDVRKGLIDRISRGDRFSRQELENIFANITCMMEGFYKPEDWYTSDKIEKFLKEEHNRIVRAIGTDLEDIELCLTRIVIIAEFVGDQVRVDYEGRNKEYDDGLYNNGYGLKLRVGNKVWAHRKFIIKKV